MSKEQKDSTENNILFFEFSFDSQICEKLIYEEINCLVTLINKIRSLLSRKDLTEEQKTCAIDDLIHNECINLEIFKGIYATYGELQCTKKCGEKNPKKLFRVIKESEEFD